MSAHGKKYFNAAKKAPKKPVSVEEAVKFVKANPGAKFDETVDVYFRLGKDCTKGDTAVRGAVKLPHHVCPNCGFYKNREILETE